MEKKDFLKQLRGFFSEKGFSNKGNHYYKALNDETVIVFGLQFTAYGGDYCYLDHGYCFNSINRYLPHPKFHQLNMNCGRIMTSQGQAIEYETVDPELLENIKRCIEKEIDVMTKLISLNREALIQYYLSGKHKGSWYILGDASAEYFGLSRNAFAGHFVLDE